MHVGEGHSAFALGMTSTEPPHQITDRLIHFVQFCMNEFLIPRKRWSIVMFIYVHGAGAFCKVRGELTANSAAYFTQATGKSTGFVSILRKKTLVCSVPGQTAGARSIGDGPRWRPAGLPHQLREIHRLRPDRFHGIQDGVNACNGRNPVPFVHFTPIPCVCRGARRS